MLGWFRASPKQKDGKGEEGKRHKAHLGEAKNKFYYDEKLKRWRVEGEEEGGDGEEDGLSSPPKLGDAGSAALGSLNYSDTGGNGFHAGGDPGAPKAFPETRGPPPRSQNLTRWRPRPPRSPRPCSARRTARHRWAQAAQRRRRRARAATARR